MREVVIYVGTADYSIACGDEEYGAASAAADILNAELRRGPGSDTSVILSKKLIMAGLQVAAQFVEAKSGLEKAQSEIASLEARLKEASRAPVPIEPDPEILSRLRQLAARSEALANQARKPEQV